MASIRLGNVSVEITINNIDGFIHEVVELPAAHGLLSSNIIMRELPDVLH